MRAMLMIGVLILSMFPDRAAAAAPPVLDRNGFLIEGAFLRFVQAHGGLEHFGEPLSDELLDAESGLPVQYFSYSRLELHGDTILATRLGSLRAAGREHEPPFVWLPADTIPAPGYVYFAESGHTLGGAFGWHHRSYHGMALLGYPISEEFFEVGTDGIAVLSQYFERAVLRYSNGAVQVEPLGAWFAERKLTAVQRTPGPPLTALAVAGINYPPNSNDGHNIELAAASLSGAIVEPGETLSFLQAVGPITAEAGYKPGTAIVGGNVVNNEIGGGVCSVSTLLYRAAWSAGLPIIERRAHRYRLRAYDDLPGMDAAIYAPSRDLRIANDTGKRLYLTVSAANGRATLTIWGRGDGRVVVVDQPNERAGGHEIHTVRRITAANGTSRRERIVTRYEVPPQPEAEEPGDRQQETDNR